MVSYVFVLLWKEGFHGDDHQFSNINKTNNHLSSELIPLNTKKTITYDIGNPGLCLWQAQKWIQWNLCNPTPEFSVILQKIHGLKVFLLTKIKRENSDMICWCVGLDRFHCICIWSLHITLTNSVLLLFFSYLLVFRWVQFILLDF